MPRFDRNDVLFFLAMLAVIASIVFAATASNIGRVWVYNTTDGAAMIQWHDGSAWRRAKLDAGQTNIYGTLYTSGTIIAREDLLAGDDLWVSGKADLRDETRVRGDLLLRQSLRFSTTTEAQEESRLFSEISTTSHTLAIYLDSESYDAAAYDEFRIYNNHGDFWRFFCSTTYAALYFYYDWNNNKSLFSIGGDTGGLTFRSLGTNRYVRVDRSGDSGIHLKLANNDGTDKVYIYDESGTPDTAVWTCDSDGNVAMTADAKMTIPDGSTEAPYSCSWTMRSFDGDNSTVGSLNSSGAVAWQGAGTMYFYLDGFPCKETGAAVVVDRLWMHYDFSCFDYDYDITIYVERLDKDSSSYATVATHAWDDQNDDDPLNLLSADVTVSVGDAFRIRIAADDGSPSPPCDNYIYSFYAEYHLE